MHIKSKSVKDRISSFHFAFSNHKRSMSAEDGLLLLSTGNRNMERGARTHTIPCMASAGSFSPSLSLVLRAMSSERRERTERARQIDTCHTHAALAHVPESALHISKQPPRRAALSLPHSPPGNVAGNISLLCPQARQACPPAAHLAAGNRQQQATRRILFP